MKKLIILTPLLFLLVLGAIPTLHHDTLDGFLTNEHIDWTAASQDFNTTGSLFVAGTGHDSFSDFVANEHIDWTAATQDFNTTGAGIFGGNLIPGTDDAYDLGINIPDGEVKRWQDLVLSGDAIIGGTGSIGEGLTINANAVTQVHLTLKGDSTPDPRGGSIEWYRDATNVGGYIYTNADNQFVWDGSAQGTPTDAGVAWVDFDDGSASFAGGAFDIDSSGNITDVGDITSDGTGTFSELIVSGNSIRITTAKTPASATDTGTEGDICWDTSYIYICTATDTWERSSLASWGVPDFLLLETGDYILLETGDKLYKENV